MSVATLPTMIVVFGPNGTYVGAPGGTTPMHQFGSIASLCTHTWRIEAAPNTGVSAPTLDDHPRAPSDVLLTSSDTAIAAAASSCSKANGGHSVPEELVRLLRGKRIATTVATDCSRSALEAFVVNTFRTFGAANVKELVVVSKALAASFAYGHERTLVLDVGLDAVTCSFVVAGVTEGCVTSRTLGAKRFLRRPAATDAASSTIPIPNASASATDLETTIDWAGFELALVANSNDISRAPLLRLLKQLPIESRKGGVPVILTGDALDVVGVYHRLVNVINPILAALDFGGPGPLTGASAATSPTSSSSITHILPASHSRPSMLHFTGASLLAALCGSVCDTIVMSRAESLTAKGLELVHSRCPGIHRPLQQPSGNDEKPTAPS